MGEPVVLPKFELHGDKPHWAVKLAWISGVLLIVAVVCLGALVIRTTTGSRSRRMWRGRRQSHA